MTITFSFNCERWPGLAKLVEECGELITAAGKLMVGEGQSDPFGNRATAGRNTTIEDLEDEIADAYASIFFVTEHCKLDEKRIHVRIREKLAKYEEWHKNNPIQMDTK